MTVLGRGAVLETSRLLAVSVHDAVGAVILRPSLGPALPLRSVRPLGRLAVDERELVGVMIVQLLPGLLPRLTVGVATGLDRPELPVRKRVGRFPKLFLPLHASIGARAANHRPRHNLAVLEVLLALLPPPPRAGGQRSLLGTVLDPELAHRARQRVLQTRLDAAPRQTRGSRRADVDVVPLLRGEDRRVGDGRRLVHLPELLELRVLEPEGAGAGGLSRLDFRRRRGGLNLALKLGQRRVLLLDRRLELQVERLLGRALHHLHGSLNAARVRRSLLPLHLRGVIRARRACGTASGHRRRRPLPEIRRRPESLGVARAAREPAGGEVRAVAAAGGRLRGLHPGGAVAGAAVVAAASLHAPGSLLAGPGREPLPREVVLAHVLRDLLEPRGRVGAPPGRLLRGSALGEGFGEVHSLHSLLDLLVRGPGGGLLALDRASRVDLDDALCLHGATGRQGRLRSLHRPDRRRRAFEQVDGLGALRAVNLGAVVVGGGSVRGRLGLGGRLGLLGRRRGLVRHPRVVVLHVDELEHVALVLHRALERGQARRERPEDPRMAVSLDGAGTRAEAAPAGPVRRAEEARVGARARPDRGRPSHRRDGGSAAAHGGCPRGRAPEIWRLGGRRAGIFSGLGATRFRTVILEL